MTAFRRKLAFYVLAALSAVIVLIVWQLSQQSRNEWLKIIEASLGQKPVLCHVVPNVEVSRKRREAGDFGHVDTVEIKSCDGIVRFYEAIPKESSSETPIIFALHQTSPYGKDEVMGYAGDPNLSYGRRFFENGFIVIAPDIFLAGENYQEEIGYSTKEFYVRYPSWSAMGKMLEDHTSIENYSRKFGRRCRVVIGHSLGAHNALFLAAFDRNIDVLVASAGFTRIASDEDAVRWARESWFVYMPKLRPHVVKAPGSMDLPWDFDSVLSAVLPRPALIIHGRNDPTWTNNVSVVDIVSEVNGRSQFGSPVEIIFHEGGHEFSAEHQDSAIKFVTERCMKAYP